MAEVMGRAGDLREGELELVSAEKAFAKMVATPMVELQRALVGSEKTR